jgi:hypothetical protein
MKVIYKKTIDLNEYEIENICSLFSKIFVGNHKSVSDFRSEFLNNEFGYSYHGMLINESDQIVGSQSYIPYYYLVDGKKTRVALSVDTMVLSGYRDMRNIFTLWLNGHKELIKDNFIFIFGFPNENAYLLRKTGLKDIDIGNLPTFILPKNISSLMPKLKFLDFFVRFFSFFLILISNFSFSRKKNKYRVERNRENFDNLRYKWFGSTYKVHETANYKIIYKIKMHNGIRTIFVMDVFPLNKKYFDQGIRSIFKIENNQFDLILYVGHLHFKPFSMIKIPTIFEQKKFHFTITLLDKNFNISPLGSLKYWDINLSSFDLL